VISIIDRKLRSLWFQLINFRKQIGLIPMCGQLLIDTLCLILETRSVLQGGTAVIK